MRLLRRDQGFVLILTVVLIPLCGFAILITTAQTAQLSRNLRYAQRRAEQKSLWLSAETWIGHNRDAVLNLEPGQSLDIPIGAIAAWPTDCTLHRTPDDPDKAEFTLTLTIEYTNRTAVINRKTSL